MCTIFTVFVLHLYYRSSSSTPLPRWARVAVLSWLATAVGLKIQARKVMQAANIARKVGPLPCQVLDNLFMFHTYIGQPREGRPGVGNTGAVGSPGSISIAQYM